VRWEQVGIKPTKRNNDRWLARFKFKPDREARTGRDFEERSVFVRESKQWCLDNFGKPHESHQTKYRWQMDNWTCHFRYEDDAFAFKMRWG
jgi:hypothetical protein